MRARWFVISWCLAGVLGCGDNLPGGAPPDSEDPEEPDQEPPAPVNRPPVAVSRVFTTGAERPLELQIEASDPDQDLLTFTTEVSPVGGELHGAGGSYIYRPSPGFVGRDVVFLGISDGAHTIRLEVGFQVTPPALATLGADGTLRLHMGPDAPLSGLPIRPDEVFQVDGTELVTVKARGYVNQFSGVTRIEADAGDGNDTIELYNDNTDLPATLRGGEGDDRLVGGGNDDTLDGGSGHDTLLGGHGEDRFVLRAGEVGEDSCSGGPNRDTYVIVGAGAAAHLSIRNEAPSRAGNAVGFRIEELELTTGAVLGSGLLELPQARDNDLEGLQIEGGSGDDRIELAADVLYGWRIYGGGGKDTIDGGSGSDELHGEGGDDTLRGNGGVDALYGGSGVDILAGGADIDFLYQDDGSNVVIE